MNESSALDVVAVRAIETADASRTLWSEDDRAWASRAAAEVVGADGGPEAFLMRRAALAVERLSTRHSALPRALNALRWRPWVASAVIGFAFVLGVFVDQVGASQRINILAPPVLGLLLWNIAVYVATAVGYVVRYGEASTAGPLRAAIARIAGGLSVPRRTGDMRDAIVALFADWARRCAPLYAMRAARILHCAAAALAIGVIAGLYMRGIAFEYRASWESTFLDPATVRSIVAAAYAPGTWITGIAVPDVASVAAIRAPAGENAARWLHLMAATLGVVVIAPRLLLALVAYAIERRRARFVVPLDDPYVQRLVRRYQGRAARVRVMSYGYAPDAAAVAALENVVTRTFGNVAMTIAPPIAYGADDLPAGDLAGTTLIALFNASATPEREVHGAFLTSLARRTPPPEGIVALIDEAAWAAHWQNAQTRIADRRAAWKQLGDEVDVPVIFVDLSAPDIAAAETAIDDALAARAH